MTDPEGPRDAVGISEEVAARLTVALTNIISGIESIQAILLDSARQRGAVEERAARTPAPETTEDQHD